MLENFLTICDPKRVSNKIMDLNSLDIFSNCFGESEILNIELLDCILINQMD